MLKPCLDCGTPTRGSRCADCRRPRESARNRRRQHYRGDYQSRRKQLREEQPNGPCYLCGQWIDPADWSAHHVIEGDPNSRLVPTHLSCNASHGDGTRGHPTIS